MTVWVIKYALTHGIESIQVDRDGDSKYVFERSRGFASNIYTLGKDVFETEEEAKAAARLLRDKKIASLKRQIKKLEALEF